MTSIERAAGEAVRAASATPTGARSGIPLPVLLLGGVVATAVLGAIAYVGAKAVQGATSGFPVDELQRNAFRAYDHSGDGVIQLDPGRRQQEFIRFASHDGSDEDSMLDDYWTVHDGSAKFVTANSNLDGSVTTDEFTTLLRQPGVDRDGNGKLRFSELVALERAFPEIEVERSSTRPDWDHPRVPLTPSPASGGAA